jgi:hypothetical protein
MRNRRPFIPGAASFPCSVVVSLHLLVSSYWYIVSATSKCLEMLGLSRTYLPWLESIPISSYAYIYHSYYSLGRSIRLFSVDEGFPCDEKD